MAKRRHKDERAYRAAMDARRARIDQAYYEHTGTHWEEYVAPPRPEIPPPPPMTSTPQQPRSAFPDIDMPWPVVANSMPEWAPFGEKGTNRAKVLSPSEFERMLEVASRGNSPYSDRAALLLSYDAGLRACEISRMRIHSQLTASGEMGWQVNVMPGTAKGGKRGRGVPMTPRLRQALIDLRAAHPNAVMVAFSFRRGHLKYRKSGALRGAYKKISLAAGLIGVSSHSGRRTFGTELARQANLSGGSIRDVQELLGHACLENTAAYIDPGEVSEKMILRRAGVIESGSAPSA